MSVRLICGCWGHSFSRSRNSTQPHNCSRSLIRNIRCVFPLSDQKRPTPPLLSSQWKILRRRFAGCCRSCPAQRSAIDHPDLAGFLGSARGPGGRDNCIARRTQFGSLCAGIRLQIADWRDSRRVSNLRRACQALVVPATHQVPIKFTAGLHHPIGQYREELQAKMHCFLNVSARPCWPQNINGMKNKPWPCLKTKT